MPQSNWGRHPYLPNGLLSLAARIMKGDGNAQVEIFDENVMPLFRDPRIDFLAKADMIGIGVIAISCIPRAIALGRRLRRMGFDRQILIGGQGVRKFTREEAERVFARIGGDVRIVRNDSDLGSKFWEALPLAHSTSMAPAIEALPEEYRRVYFRNEWCLYVSRGCSYSCKFCLAENRESAVFRIEESFQDEVECLARMVRRYAGPNPSYEVYLSSLDGLQDVGRMELLLRCFAEAMKRNGVSIGFRCLATAAQTVRATGADPGLLVRWHSYGMRCIGLGVDGADESTWNRERKGHNTEAVIEKAFRAIEQSGILAEAVMVMAFPDDDSAALARTVRSSYRYARRGMIVHLYLAKTTMPGSQRWKEDFALREQYLQYPDLFADADFSSFASPMTHPVQHQRRLSNLSYVVAVCSVRLLSPHGCATHPLIPTVGSGLLVSLVGLLVNRMAPTER